MEMLVVIAIMGTLLSIGIVSISEYYNRIKLRTATETIAADIRLARWIAKTSASTCFITFDTASNTYIVNGTQTQIARLPEGLWFGVDTSVTSRPTQPSSAPPADGISFDSGTSRNVARFYVSGTVAPTGAVYVTDGKSTMAVTVAITGRPKIWRSSGGRRWIAL